nr:immunoglobulin light chain junction region [Macaca mulatta]
CLQYESRPFTF